MRATADIVRCLIAEQCPASSHLPLRPVDLDGWDNTTFRLGDSHSVRLPSADGYVVQIEKEHRWLPRLAALLPMAIPSPSFLGVPGCGFPRPWSVYGWIDGAPAVRQNVTDRVRLAAELAEFLVALQRVPTEEGPAAGPHSFGRGGPVAQWDTQVRTALESLAGQIKAADARRVWEHAVEAQDHARAVWLHGDVTGSNLIVRDDALAGVIDFGCCAVGDPACDLVAAWTLFDGESRAQFVRDVGQDEATWARARGWAFWKALISMDGRPRPDVIRSGARFGWVRSADEVLDELIAGKPWHTP